MSKFKNRNGGKPRKVLSKAELLKVWKGRAAN